MVNNRVQKISLYNMSIASWNGESVIEEFEVTWWSWGESNPCPETSNSWRLHV